MSATQLTLQEAKEYINAWRDLSSNEKGDAIKNLKAWLIPHDTVDALFNDSVYAIRTYLGFDTSNSEVKLIIVGTNPEIDGVQSDIINLDGSLNTKIYNFSHPCPPGCDPNSALF